ncbi:MAG: hypothetical protein WBX25_29205 [Rhodomicrobium sp.]
MMLAPIEITFDGVQQSDAIEGYIRNEIENLRDVDARVTSSTIVITKPGAKHFSGILTGCACGLRSKGVQISTSIMIQARASGMTRCR